MNNLPLPLTSFIGRDVELAEVHRLMGEARLLTLTGSGGCGKSRLALQVAADSVAAHPDGAGWVELIPVAHADLVPQAVVLALGLRDAPREPLEQLSEYLANQHLLLVLDNCEHVLQATAELAHALLVRCPRLAVLATSREPLGVPGEQTWRVPSLSEPDATALFSDRATRARPNFRVTEENAASIALICERIDGIPLAVELAAARIRTVSPQQIAAGLDDRFRLLTGGPRTVTPRHQTLLASVAWSHDLLSPEERTLFRRLSVFVGGFSLDAAEMACAGGGQYRLDHLAVLDHLGRLVDKSLVAMDEDGAGARYRFLETIRQFAADRLIDAGEAPEIRDRHAECFRLLAEGAEGLVEAADRPCLDQLEAEHDNLRAAHEWLLGRDPTSALRLVAALPLFWYQRGHYREGRRRLREALDAAPPTTDAALRARALWGLAHLTFYQGDFQEAFGLAEEALAAADEAKDDRLRARSLGLLGWMELFVDAVAARARLEEAVPLARGGTDLWCLADNLQALGWTYMVQEDLAAARPYLEETAAVASRLGNPYFLAWNGGAFGQEGVRKGDYGAAAVALDAGIAASRAVGEPDTLHWALAWMVEMRVAVGDYDGARAALNDEGFLELKRRMGGSGPTAIEWLLAASRAHLLMAVGDLQTARDWLNDSIARSRTEMVLWPLMLSLVTLAALEVGEGELAAAKDHAMEAAEHAGRMGNEWVVAEARHVLATVACAEGAWTRAESLFHQALAVRAEQGFRPAVADTLEGLASLAAELESWTEAVRLLAAAARLREEIGYRRWPSRQPAWDAFVARVRQGVGEAAFDEAWSQGMGLSLHEAVAYAARARGERKRPSSGWASLTPTERQVVALVADGLTNALIGEQLFMSLGTVKTHLAHVFTKLGITTRAQLASEAARRETHREVP